MFGDWTRSGSDSPRGRANQPTKPAPSNVAGESAGMRRAKSVAVAVASRGPVASHRQQQQQRQTDSSRTLAPISSVTKKSTVFKQDIFRFWGHWPFHFLMASLGVCQFRKIVSEKNGTLIDRNLPNKCTKFGAKIFRSY